VAFLCFDIATPRLRGKQSSVSLLRRLRFTLAPRNDGCSVSEIPQIVMISGIETGFYQKL